jgi:hypothetical protein
VIGSPSNNVRTFEDRTVLSINYVGAVHPLFPFLFEMLVDLCTMLGTGVYDAQLQIYFHAGNVNQ